MPRRLWIDTDVGTNPDDAVALLVAAAHPGVELVGVSVAGDDRGRRAGVAAGLVPGVPVIGSGGVAEVVAAVAGAAPDAVLAIGPLTNVAAVYPWGGQGPGPALTIMGGAVRPVWHRGELRDVESNFGADPAAAAAVLRAVPGATVVPLDATVATGLDEAAERRLLEVAPELAGQVERWRSSRPGVAVHLHDPAALLIALGESDLVGAVAERCRLGVEGDGRVVVEQSGQTGHNLVTSVDGGAVFDRVLHVLAARG